MKNSKLSVGLLTSVLAASALVLATLPAGTRAATNTAAELNSKGAIVQSNTSSASLPPEVARYLNGPIREGQQFAFLIGDWDVDASKLNADGSILFRYKATWSAQYLNEGRMVMDDFKALAPDGRPISSYVTLRTYSESTQRWEMTGLAAMQPAAGLEWHGVWTGDEMQIDAAGIDPAGRAIKTKIRFSRITPERFLWESESSADSGNTWTRTASLVATRAAARSPE